ncbi:MAG: hypothetical protein IKZ87_01350 [Actinomycetaceae bacterium]|nr:hypothetical protein [Actinomycetaceae bacterium]
MSKVVAVESKTYSKKCGDKRYILVDSETGEILDTAQGYGYRTPQGAHAAWAYKNRDKSKDKEKAAKRAHIKKWMKEHKGFVKVMDKVSFEIWKGSWGPDDKFNAALVAELLKEAGLKPDFTAGELLRVWESS